MNNINNNYLIIGIIILILIILIAFYFFYNQDKDEEIIDISNTTIEKETNINKEENENNEVKNKIYIHVSGAVAEEDVYLLDENARVSDAIEKAGGLTAEADITDVNLAYKLQDGQKIFIPSKYKEEEKYKITTSFNSKNDEETIENEIGIVNINTASSEELQTLPGIGEAAAEKIIEYRKANGKFNSIEEIKNVNGIGEAKFASMQSKITV